MKRLCTYNLNPGIKVLAWIILLLTVNLECTTDKGLPPGDPDNGGLALPVGFEATVVVDSLSGRARHLAVRDNGDIYVKLLVSMPEGGCAALRDTNNDGKADVIKYFGKYPVAGWEGLSTGIHIYQNYIYFSSELNVYRM